MGNGSRRLIRNQAITAINSIINALPAGTNKIGTFSHSNTGIGDGRKEVAAAGTPETLAASTACTKVTITAEEDNTGVIVVGGSSVKAALATRQGTPLNALEDITIEIDDLVKIYLDSTVSGEGVTFSYSTEEV